MEEAENRRREEIEDQRNKMRVEIGEEIRKKEKAENRRKKEA